MGNQLYVRNAAEAICYELATVESPRPTEGDPAEMEE